MPNDLENIARQQLSPCLGADVDCTQLGLDDDMAGTWGLTSLNKVLFITSLCDAASFDIGGLTEEDLDNMRTLRDVIMILGAGQNVNRV